MKNELVGEKNKKRIENDQKTRNNIFMQERKTV